jgi:hypothetical protein
MIYEYECPEHGKFERIFTIAEMEDHDRRGNFVCPTCMEQCERLVSVPQIEPDPYWAGQGEYKNLAEKKAIQRNTFSPTRGNIEQVNKNKRARERAVEKRRHDTLVDIVRNVDNP